MSVFNLVTFGHRKHRIIGVSVVFIMGMPFSYAHTVEIGNSGICSNKGFISGLYHTIIISVNVPFKRFLKPYSKSWRLVKTMPNTNKAKEGGLPSSLVFWVFSFTQK